MQAQKKFKKNILTIEYSLETCSDPVFKSCIPFATKRYCCFYISGTQVQLPSQNATIAFQPTGQEKNHVTVISVKSPQNNKVAIIKTDLQNQLANKNAIIANLTFEQDKNSALITSLQAQLDKQDTIIIDLQSKLFNQTAINDNLKTRLTNLQVETKRHKYHHC